MMLRITCPSCSQDFEVSEELRGRTVECGACEARFQVTDGVMIEKPKKWYPEDVRRAADLTRFGRGQGKGLAPSPVEFTTTTYNPAPNENWIGPVPLTRTFASLVGIALVVLTGLLFYVGSRPEGVLQDFEVSQRMTLAGFFGALSLCLLWWGMVRNRVVGTLVGLLGSAGLLALAYFMPVYRTAAPVANPVPVEEEPGEREVRDVRELMSEKKLTIPEVIGETRWTAAIQPLLVSQGEGNVAVVWAGGMEERFRFQLQNYLKQVFRTASAPTFYNREDGGIFIIERREVDLDRVAASSERFGEVEEVYPDLRIVQVKVDVTVLSEPSVEVAAKLNDPTEGAFYALNWEELAHLDQERVEDAVRRLSRAEPLSLRADITARLAALVKEEQDDDFYGELAKALLVWSEPGDDSEKLVAAVGNQIQLEGKRVPQGVLDFVAERQVPEASAFLVNLWAETPRQMQGYLETYGAGLQGLILPYLGDSNPGIARSAASLLSTIATPSVLGELRAARAKAVDEEVKLTLQKAIGRLGG
ncbi:MAG: hypothetical protein AAGC74_14485 [Verrucomicrobiota bacterium]